jgi:hypothetical protein
MTVSLAVAGRVSAQGSAAWEKGWVDVNFGAALAAEKDPTTLRTTPLYSETARGAVAYSFPTGGSFDVGGGYMFTPRIGVGVSLAGTAHEDSAGLAISVPHPFFFNAAAADATVTSGRLKRSEGAWHLQAMLVAASTPRVRLRVFGGPSYFAAEQDVVSLIKYDQVYQVFARGNSVDILSYDTHTSEGSGWGLHVGADVSIFFTRVVGVGGMFRLSGGSVDMDDYGGTESRKVGGVQMGGGLRLKF